MFYYRTDSFTPCAKGHYKVHLVTCDGYSAEPPTKHETPVLYQLENDPGERFNVAAEHPDVVADILHEVEKHKQALVPGTPQF